MLNRILPAMRCSACSIIGPQKDGDGYYTAITVMPFIPIGMESWI